MGNERYWAVVPAAGRGKRMGGEVAKQYLEMAGRTVIEHTLERLLSHQRIAGVVVAIAADDRQWAAVGANFGERLTTTTGGAERCHSVLAGLASLAGRAAAGDWVLVHDAARPCLRVADIARMMEELDGHDCGGILAVPVRDTLKRCGESMAITETVDRTGLWHALTPQMFRFSRLREAIERALAANVVVTDEAHAIELAGGVPRIVQGHVDNIKITHPDDLPLAALYLGAQAGA